jgi:L-seryl-tRNA(Ser) seleniumtransferase
VETSAGSREHRRDVSDPDLEHRLRALPSVEELLETEPLRSVAAHSPHPVAVAAAREEIERRRDELRNGNGGIDVTELAASAAASLEQREAPSLREVINATGVVVHTNLGRAPLADEALEALDRVGRGYTNLEYDLERGERGSRHTHLEELIRELTGAEAGFAVNNNAAAVLLAMTALADGREVVISRGQLVEIGGSFRIPDVLAQSGARLVEVGTTNRTRLSDYERGIGPETVAVMRVHCSNFRTVGFTEEASIEELCALGRQRGLMVIDDLGSGVIGRSPQPITDVFRDEPAVRRSIAAGADVVCFSADKLMGGPQAGVVAGRREAMEKMRSHPLARALRIDKLSLAALEATLLVHRDPERAATELPVLRMLGAGEDELALRAARLRDAIVTASGSAAVANVRVDASGLAEVRLERAAGRVGGGALPLVELEGPVVTVRPRQGGPDRLQARLRANDPPIIARVQKGALVLDPRTIGDEQVEPAAAGVVTALR